MQYRYIIHVCVYTRASEAWLHVCEACFSLLTKGEKIKRTYDYSCFICIEPRPQPVVWKNMQTVQQSCQIQSSSIEVTVTAVPSSYSLKHFPHENVSKWSVYPKHSLIAIVQKQTPKKHYHQTLRRRKCHRIWKKKKKLILTHPFLGTTSRPPSISPRCALCTSSLKKNAISSSSAPSVTSERLSTGKWVIIICVPKIIAWQLFLAKEEGEKSEEEERKG